MINLIIGLILGVIIYLLTIFNLAEEKRFSDFIIVKEHYVTTILNLLTGLVILISYSQNPGTLEIIGITKMTFLTAALVGFLGHNLWSIIVNAFSSRVKTKLGVNRK